jgi:hypothetical protein
VAGLGLAVAIAPSLPLQRRPFLASVKTEIITEVLKRILGRLARREAHDTSTALSEDAEQGLKRYLEMERYVLAEIKRGNRDAIPADVAFLFGHTHKPFERTTRYESYHAPISLLNSGGWVVDSLYTNKLHGGAILFVDETSTQRRFVCIRRAIRPMSTGFESPPLPPPATLCLSDSRRFLHLNVDSEGSAPAPVDDLNANDSRSSLGRFEAFPPYRAAPKGVPSCSVPRGALTPS